MAERITDAAGYGIVPGCFVRKVGSPRKHNGWVREIEDGVLLVDHAVRGGLYRWKPNEVNVARPDELDHARKKGQRLTRESLVGGDPRRPRKL